jgi:L-ribulose-5-phosphate 4-epimerase
MMNEGYIKFSCVKIRDTLENFPLQFEEFNQFRAYCCGLALIGMFENGIGYGNISVRINDTSRFIISGSKTGGKTALTKDDYCEIVSFNSEKNEVNYNGKIEPSSETMSHGSVYAANRSIKTIVHVHHAKIFNYLKENNFHSTSKDALFGTVQLAHEIEELIKHSAERSGIFYMEGHAEGVIAYSDSIENIRQLVGEIYEKANYNK